MKNRIARGKRLGAIMAVALAALLVVTACAPAPTTPGEEIKVVEVGYLSPLTGAGSAQEQIFAGALFDYVKYFNEEDRIPGVTVEVTWRDVERSVAKFISTYEIFKARGVPVMTSSQTDGPAAFRSRFEQDQIPLYSGNPVKEIVYPPGWFYFRSLTWGEQFAAVADYIMENWQEDRPPKVAIMAMDTTFGREPLPEAVNYAESIGIEMLPTVFVPFVVLDATTQLLRLKEQEAEFVYVSGLMVTSGPIVRDAERLGLLDQLQFCGIEASAGARLIQMAGAASEGYFVPKTVPSRDETDVPGIKLMQDVQMKYHGEVTQEEEYVYGWTGTAILCEAVKRAVEQVGYENVDGPAMKQAFDSIKDFDVDGLVTITYTPDDHRGSNRIAIYQVQGGKLVRASDWRAAPSLAPQG